MTILITGASGMIGTHLCTRLVTEEYEVVALLRSVNSQLDILENNHRNFRIAYSDIRDRQTLFATINSINPDTVFHLAASCLPCHNDYDFNTTNIDGTVNLTGALLCCQHTLCDFILASTASVYSIPTTHLPVDEQHPTQPDRAYGVSKLMSERICHINMDSVTRVPVLRLASVFGIGDSTRVAGLFMKAAVTGEPLLVQGDGEQSSDFIYVDDAVQGLITAWRNRTGDTGTFNIGSGYPTKIIDLAKYIISVTESKSDIVLSGESNRPFPFWLDVTKARQELGYSPRSLLDSLEKYRERFEQNPDNGITHHRRS